jgi:nicotinate-nucleotide--dimethylbenzimidazole phosphoribosyltransferase
MKPIESVVRDKSSDPLLDLTSWVKAVGATRPMFALSQHEIAEAHRIDTWPDSFSAGSDLADQCVDQGARLVLIDGGPGETVHRALICLLTTKDAARVLPPYTPGVDDLVQWQSQTRAIADLGWRHREALANVDANPALLGCNDSAALAGLLIGLAARKTPVVIHNVVAHSAALLAQRMSRRSTGWIAAATVEDDLASKSAQEKLAIPRIINGALALEMQKSALPLVSAHIMALAAIDS